MRRLSFGDPLPGSGSFERFVMEALREIERATVDDIEAVVSEFKVTGDYTESRTLDAESATLGDVRDFLATFVNDIKNRGQKRSYGT
jgi:hypothetical protein